MNAAQALFNAAASPPGTGPCLFSGMCLCLYSPCLRGGTGGPRGARGGREGQDLAQLVINAK